MTDSLAQMSNAELSTAGGDRSRRWRTVIRRPAFVLPAAVVALLLIISAMPSQIAGFFGNGDPRACDLNRSGEGPADGHPFGFDLQGCDVYANVIFGTQASISVGLLTTALSVILAIVLGTLAGFFGRFLDFAVTRFIEVFLGFPFLLGAIVVLNTVGERNVVTVSAVLALFSWPLMARLVRSSVRSVSQAEYVLAARTLGLSTWRIILRYVLPNSLSPVIVIATISVGSAIVAESSLTYLGIGLEAPVISWGLQLASASNQFQNSPHLLIFPALFLAVTVLSIISLGDTLRAAFDPRRQQ